MSLRPQPPLPPVPDDTARVARAAFRRGNPYVLLRDQFGALFDDADFADLCPKLGQPAYAPWRLALVTLMQFREGLSDRQAAEAVRSRIDWKHVLALDLSDAGFDFSVLCEFRARLLQHGVTERLLTRVLDAAREGGLLKGRGRSRTDSTHVLAAVRDLNRVELLAETLRAALNAIATTAPDWLRALSPPEWHERYDRRIEEVRLPEAGSKRDAYVAQVGADGFVLLDALDGVGTPESLCSLSEIDVLRRVWARHFERADGDADGHAPQDVRLRQVKNRGPGDRIESPYDADARFRTKAAMGWTGHMAHFTETCDENMPRLVVHADTTTANVHEAMRTEPIHAALAAKGLAPAEHLVDAAYTSAEQLVAARERHDIDLVGPQRRNLTWQSTGDGAFDAAGFTVDWDRQVACCPEGKESVSWKIYSSPGRARGHPLVHARFHPANCRACSSRPRCARSPSQGRVLSFFPRREQEALMAARARERTDEYRRLYAQRQGIEGTMSQGVRVFGLRQARYCGLAKTKLQHVATAAAINLDRLAAWFAKRPLAPTRTSRFAALAA